MGNTKAQRRAVTVPCIAIQVLPIDGTRKEATCREAVVTTVCGAPPRITTISSAAGAAARIAVIVQTGCGFLSGGRLSRTWLAFMDESQQYGNYHEIAALAAIQQLALIVFVWDHRQTPGGLSKERAAHRPLGLRALNRSGDYLPPARLAKLIALLWPDASQDNDSEVACLLNVGQAPHTGVWTAATTTQHPPTSLARLFSEETLSHLNVASCLISAILAVLLIATAPEEFGIPECTTTVEAAGLDGPHRWGIILPNSSRVSLLTYKAIVAVRYPELVFPIDRFRQKTTK